MTLIYPPPMTISTGFSILNISTIKTIVSEMKTRLKMPSTKGRSKYELNMHATVKNQRPEPIMFCESY